MDRPSVEARAAAARRDEQSALERVIHDGKFEPFTTRLGNDTQNCGKLCAKLVVPSSGSIIHRCSLRFVQTALFGEDRMVREGAVERPDNRLLGFLVGLRNEIDRVGLAGDLDSA